MMVSKSFSLLSIKNAVYQCLADVSARFLSCITCLVRILPGGHLFVDMFHHTLYCMMLFNELQCSTWPKASNLITVVTAQ